MSVFQEDITTVTANEVSPLDKLVVRCSGDAVLADIKRIQWTGHGYHIVTEDSLGSFTFGEYQLVEVDRVTARTIRQD